MAILFGLGVPSFREWIQSSQIRTAAEAVQNGLELARAEAVKLNTPVRFQLTDTLDNSCQLSTTGTNWVVNQGGAASNDPTGACATAPSNSVAPLIIQKRPGGEGTRNAKVVASQTLVVFNGLGRTDNVPAGGVIINISNDTLAGDVGKCVADGGEMRCLRVVVHLGGQIRMCDPAVVWSTATPQGC